MKIEIIRPSAPKLLMLPLIGLAFVSIVIAVTPGSEWFHDLKFFLGYTLIFLVIGAPFLGAQVALASGGDIRITWFGFVRHRFNAREVTLVKNDKGQSSMPRWLGIFSYSGMEIFYGMGDRTKRIVLLYSLYRIQDLKSISAFLSEHDSSIRFVTRP